MESDEQLRRKVSAELEWDPSIPTCKVGVSVKNGIVTLTGHLDTYSEKSTIEKAVTRVQGVKAIAVEMDVKLEPDHKRSDTEIAASIQSAFMWHAQIPADRIQVKVEKGCVSLTGEVDWHYQRQSAEEAVRPIIGVVDIANYIRLKTSITPANVSLRIHDAFTRHAQREAKDIEVLVSGSTVTLRGTVDSLTERTVATNAAWSAPGISNVVNEIRVYG